MKNLKDIPSHKLGSYRVLVFYNGLKLSPYQFLLDTTGIYLFDMDLGDWDEDEDEIEVVVIIDGCLNTIYLETNEIFYQCPLDGLAGSRHPYIPLGESCEICSPRVTH